MNFSRSVAALAATTFALSSAALAEDIRVTVTGTVSEINSGGIGIGPFANAAIGDAVTITVDIELARQLPFGDYGYLVNTPSSTATVGSATDGFQYSQANVVSLNDDFALFGEVFDAFGVTATFASDPTAAFQIYIRDLSATAWSTRDLSELVGTTLMGSAFESLFQLYSPLGRTYMTVDTIQIDAAPGGPVGTPYCMAEPNSTGNIGTTSAYGLLTPGDNDLTLRASGLPTQTFGYFIVSDQQGFVPQPGGSQGNLCLGGSIGRFAGPGQVTATDFGGEIHLPVDLQVLPQPMGTAAVQVGQTWNVQLWHRDSSPTGPTSNFTQALSLTF